MADEAIFPVTIDAEVIAAKMKADPDFAFETLAWLAEKLSWDGESFIADAVVSNEANTSKAIVDFHRFIHSLERGATNAVLQTS